MEKWTKVSTVLPYSDMRVRVRYHNGAVEAVRMIKVLRDVAGAARSFWHDGRNIDETKYEEWQAIPGEKPALGPGFC